MTAEQLKFAEAFAPFIANAWNSIAYDYITCGDEGDNEVPHAEAVEAALDANRPSFWAPAEDKEEATRLEKMYYGNATFSNAVKQEMFEYWNLNLGLATCL